MLAAIIALLLVAAVARADGDPASDVLLRADVFFPYGEPVSASLREALDTQTAAAARARFPVKVALIQSPADLGAVASLFGRPQTYADFLEQEIGLQHTQTLLVVMPQGFGIEGPGRPTAAATASLVEPAGGRSDDLARAAIADVRALAAAAGGRLHATERASTPGGDSLSVTLELAGAALAAMVVLATLFALAVSRWVWSDRIPSAERFMPTGMHDPVVRPMSIQSTRLRSAQPLVSVALVLMFGGVLWSFARGLEFYGLSPVGVGYDLDQPPLLLVIAGVWLWYRSRRR